MTVFVMTAESSPVLYFSSAQYHVIKYGAGKIAVPYNTNTHVTNHPNKQNFSSMHNEMYDRLQHGSCSFLR